MAEVRSPTIRFQTLERDRHTCQECGLSGSNIDLHVHHIIPLDENGDDELSNTVTLCRPCHAKRHVRPDSDYALAFAAILQEFPVVTSRDIAESVGCSRERARQWLVSMWEDDKIERRDMHSGSKAYYPPYRTSCE